MAAFRASLYKYSAAKRSVPSLLILPEISDAISCGRPVVALESTILAHGMPYPQNLELAKDVSQILRSKGCIPATIAIKNGVFRAGLYHDEMENLAKAGEEGRAIKCSTRDLPLIASKHQCRHSEEDTLWGATTVAATMKLAHLSGISTFVTGGTGGVHRGGELSLDVSTDLIQLSRTPIVVVSAGVKSILDVRRTLEVLETYAVPTGTWKSDEFPAFFSPASGVRSPARFDSANEVASAYLLGKDLGLTSGMLVAVPNNDPSGEHVEAAIKDALQEAENAGVEGRDVTPFILKTVAEKTSGDSLRSNIALVKNNADVGADIANAILDKSRHSAKDTIQSSQLPLRQARVVCVGGCVLDTVARPSDESEFIKGTSNIGIIDKSDGGVARNVVEVLSRLGSKTLFYTAIGDDGGQGIISRLGNVTTPNSLHVAKGFNTAQYLALLDHEYDLLGGVADMEVLSQIPTPTVDDMRGIEYLVLDANGTVESVTKAAKNGLEAGCQAIAFEPTSVAKAQLLCANSEFVQCLKYTFPNEDELIAMAEALIDGEDKEESCNSDDDEYLYIKDAASVLLSNMQPNAHVIVTLAERGVILASKTVGKSSPEFKHFKAEVVSTVRSTNGAGDTLCGAFIHAMLQGATIEEAIRFGMKAAILSLNYARGAISPNISSDCRKVDVMIY